MKTIKKTIKISLSLLILSLSINSVNAQSGDTIEATTFNFGVKSPKQGSVLITKKYKNFAGTWYSKEGNSELTLNLALEYYPVGKPVIYLLQTLNGGIKYSNNNSVIANTLSNKQRNITALNDKNRPDDELSMVLSYEGNSNSIHKFKNHPFTLKLLDKNTLIILPNKINQEGVLRDSKYNFIYNLKLKRQ